MDISFNLILPIINNYIFSVLLLPKAVSAVYVMVLFKMKTSSYSDIDPILIVHSVE